MLEQKLQEAVRAIPAPAGLKANIVAACREALAAPVAEKKATVAPVWRWTAAVACLLLAAGVTWKLLPRDNGGVVPNPHATSTTATKQTNATTSTGTTQSTTQSTTSPTIYYPTTPNPNDINANELPVQPYGSGEGTGGSTPYAAFKSDKFDGVFNGYWEWLYKNYGKNVITDVYGTFATNSEKYIFSEKSMGIYDIVRRFHMTRETFVEINERQKEICIKNGWEWDLKKYTFTDEEIDDIYNLTWLEFARKYAAYDALITDDGKIYSLWAIIQNPVEKWAEKGFTIDQLKTAYQWAKHYTDTPHSDEPESFYFACYSNRERYSDIDFAIFEEKLVHFIAAERGYTDLKGINDGTYNTYISHTRWNRIDDIVMQHMVDIYGQEAVDAFKAQLAAEKTDKPYLFRGDAVNRWIAHFGITQQEFEALNAQLGAHYAETYGADSFEYWDNVFTDEEINDIYTLSLQDFNMKYANPCTLVKGEFMFPFEWFFNGDWDTWSWWVIKARNLNGLLDNFKCLHPDATTDIDRFADAIKDYSHK